MAVRLSRAARREQIRADLIASARRVFLRRGFHSASLEEIAQEAGWSKGAVFSNFAGKDELFLAVVDEQYERRLRVASGLPAAAGTLDDVVRAAARDIAETFRQDPAWTPLLVEFWTHAARRPAVRAEVERRHARMLDVLAEAIAGAAAEAGVEFTVPVREIARAANALQRGLALEGLVDAADPAALIEDALMAYMRGVVRQPPSPSP
jgi:AcrR family transcriptional regulator